MKHRKKVIWAIIVVLVILLIFYYNGCDDEKSASDKANESDNSDLGLSNLCENCPICPDLDENCPVCPSCDNDCPAQKACDSCCPSCPDAKTVVEGASELASSSLATVESYFNRIINTDNENFTFRLVNTKDYTLNNIHSKLIVKLNDSVSKTFLSEVYSLGGKENKSFQIPVTLDPRSDDYEAKLTVYSANNNGLTKDVVFKVYNQNPDVEQSMAFWSTNVIGFADYRLTQSKTNVTFVNNKNSDVTVVYLKIGGEQWLVNKTIVSGDRFEFVKDKGLCSNGIYNLPVYINYTSGGFEFEIKESQELVGYCR